MTWIILALLGFLALWIGGGLLLLARNARKLGTNYQREVAGRVYLAGDDVAVTVRLIAPDRTRVVEDHDVLLAMDHSSSMGGGPGSPLREAIRSVENFLRWLPDNMHTGIVGFDHEAHQLCPLTAQRSRAQSALRALSSGGGTALHAALERCREAFLSDGRPNVRKTLILLTDGVSDHEAAIEATARLRAEVAGINIICVGFDLSVNEELLRAIAGAPDHYLHVGSVDELDALFSSLAAAVSGQTEVGFVEEGARAPSPFQLAKTSGLYPIRVQPGDTTRIVWSIPLTSTDPTPLSYTLVPLCPGWHAVATPDSRVVWRMADGKNVEQRGPDGPRVLVMPRWLGWAWLILNPLFWMIFGKFWRCAPVSSEAVDTSEPAPLPAPTLPALLPAPQERVYEPRLRPALVVGLGEQGEWVTCRLKDRLRDRGVDSSLVDLLTIHVTHRANRKPIRVGRTELDPHEHIEIHQDLRPYLESLRDSGTPQSRRWVPWRRWLAEMPPLTTLRTIADDRRKARLALIQSPDAVEEKLAAPLQRVLAQDGLVIVVGSASDAECSGLLAEVAHICAAAGAGVTAVFTPTSFFRQPSTAELALARELERMSLMSGKNIVSDRHQPLVEARQLFDRIAVIEQQEETAAASSLPAAELIWHMLAFTEVFERLPVLRPDGDEVVCNGVEIDSSALPAHSLWEWVRERTLALGINGQRLGLTEQQGRLTLTVADRQLIQNDVKAFWSGQNCARPQNSLLDSSKPVAQSDEPDPVATLLALQDRLPVDQPYHEQVAYGRRERQVFAAYLEEWCQYILNREQQGGSWGLHVLMPALLRVEDEMQLIINRLGRLSGNEDFAGLISFSSSVYTDLIAIVNGLRSSLAQWIAKLVGAQIHLRVDAPAGGGVPVAYDIEQNRQLSEKAFSQLYEQRKEFIDQQFEQWYKSYGDPLLGQMRLRVGLDSASHRVYARFMHADKEMDAGDVAEEMRSTLDHYRNVVLTWPLQHLIRPAEVSNPLERFRVGKYSALAYPGVTRVANEDDPFLVSSILVRERTIRESLKVVTPPAGEVPYTWPEEANAARLAEQIRNRLNRDPQPFSPVAVHLLRDTQKLRGFIAELADGGSVVARGARFVLRRDGHDYDIGPRNESLTGLDAFKNVVQQVVSLELSLDGERLPPPVAVNSSQAHDEVLKAVEAHPLAKAAVGSADWQMWRDVIHGLWLEHDSAQSAPASKHS